MINKNKSVEVYKIKFNERSNLLWKRERKIFDLKYVKAWKHKFPPPRKKYTEKAEKNA